jgi:hypothetical protein
VNARNTEIGIELNTIWVSKTKSSYWIWWSTAMHYTAVRKWTVSSNKITLPGDGAYVHVLRLTESKLLKHVASMTSPKYLSNKQCGKGIDVGLADCMYTYRHPWYCFSWMWIVRDDRRVHAWRFSPAATRMNSVRGKHLLAMVACGNDSVEVLPCPGCLLTAVHTCIIMHAHRTHCTCT